MALAIIEQEETCNRFHSLVSRLPSFQLQDTPYADWKSKRPRVFVAHHPNDTVLSGYRPYAASHFALRALRLRGWATAVGCLTYPYLWIDWGVDSRTAVLARYYRANLSNLARSAYKRGGTCLRLTAASSLYRLFGTNDYRGVPHFLNILCHTFDASLGKWNCGPAVAVYPTSIEIDGSYVSHLQGHHETFNAYRSWVLAWEKIHDKYP